MFHSVDRDTIIDELGVDPAKGLSGKKAAELLKENGENKLREKKKRTMLSRFAGQFKDVMILILIAAAVVSFVVAVIEGHGEFFEPALIVLIVVLNAVMGVLQESKAEKALDALQNLSAPHARVLRDGTEAVIDAKELVIGDIIMLEAGDFIPADARLLESSSLKVEESALTGESLPAEKNSEAEVKKNAALGDRLNMVYSGCSVVYGRAKAVVVAVGMDTEIGKIANLLDGEAATQTPLQQKLAQLGKYLGFIALGACAVIFVVGLIDKMPVMEIFMIAISLAVSAIPEGLPAIVTIVLSIGVTKMVKKNAIIKRLPAVETLGSASVICSDKTGTLTQNRMTLVKLYTDKDGELSDLTFNAGGSVKELLKYATLCCDAAVTEENNIYKFIGDPTETSIVFAAHKNGMTKEKLNSENQRIGEIPFDSDRKLMTTINVIDGKKTVIVKGAFDELAKRCTGGNLERASELTEKMSGDALRVLGVAYKTIDSLPEELTSEKLESGLTLLGLIGMIDPPRNEAKRAVEVCRKAGIKPVMITGDHIITASAIARQLGIYVDGDDAITGEELAKLSEQQLSDRVRSISVYARVSPEDKIRIVKAWQAQGEIVAMTGDGVNDAPALKASDIGCAMGITGTDVAKGAADIILTDDNFATIVDAVKEGRGIYDNIKKVVGFLLGTNIGEVLVVFIAMLLWGVSPFLSVQLLWINLATDSLPAIALGMEGVESDVMSRKPKPKSENIFANGFGLRIILQGIMFAAITLFGYKLGFDTTGQVEGGRTVAFLVLALSQIIHSFNMRSNKSLFKSNPFSNKYLNGAVLLSALLICLIVFIPPVANAFGMIQLSFEMYFIALSFALIPVVVMEVAKWVRLVK